MKTIKFTNLPWYYTKGDFRSKLKALSPVYKSTKLLYDNDSGLSYRIAMADIPKNVAIRLEKQTIEFDGRIIKITDKNKKTHFEPEES